MIKETLYANSYKEMDFGDSGVACLIVNDTAVREKLTETQLEQPLANAHPPPPGVKLYKL